jgi:hypothetical protein
MAKAKPALQQDPANANKGTDTGKDLLARSVGECGLGRPILADKNGIIIAGNKTTLAAGAIDVQFVETTGEELVVVQREDLDIETDGKARKLAILDNRTAQVNLSWDSSVLRGIANAGDQAHLGFTADELSAIDTISSAQLSPSENTNGRVALRFSFGRYRFDMTQEQMDEFSRQLEGECTETGRTWQEIIHERLGL